MTTDNLFDDLTPRLQAERDRVAAVAAASRERLRLRLDDLEAFVAGRKPHPNGSGAPPEPAHGGPVTESVTILTPLPPEAQVAPEQAPGAPGAPSAQEVAPEPPAAPSPAQGPPPHVSPEADPRVIKTSRRLLLVGGIVLLFVAHQRWLTPWVAHNGQARLRTGGEPTLSIPKLKLDLAVARGTDPGALRKGPGHDRRSSKPGSRGNVVIAGHHTTYGRPFARLGRLEQGDIVTLTDKAAVNYEVRSVQPGVGAGDRSVRAQQGDDRLTLVTASSKGRMVVVAVAAADQPLKGTLPAKGEAGGTLWPTNTLVVLGRAALWIGAAFGLARGARLLRLRWGRAATLLAAVPAGTIVVLLLVDAVEQILGTLY